MKNKRGISPLLATVLLVAFTVALAAIVSTFLINKAKAFDPAAIAEQSVFCESVTLGYTIASDPIDDFKTYSSGNDPASGKNIPSGITVLGTITLINRGSFSIHRLIVTSTGLASRPYPIIDYTTNRTTSIKPGEKYDISIQINPSSTDKSIKIVPMINDSEKSQFVKCPDRQIVIANYTALCEEVHPGIIC